MFNNNNNLFICAVCGKDKDVVCSLPTNKQILEKWSTILNTPSILVKPRQKRICLLHFKTDYHGILKNPVCKRGPYIFPLEWNDQSINNENTPTLFTNSSSLKRPLPLDTTLHNKSKKAVNYDLILSQKNDEIAELNNKIKGLKIEMAELSKETNRNLNSNETISKILNESSLSDHSKAMVRLLLLRKNCHVYDTKEKALCQSIYYKNTGAYNHLRKLLDNKLPSARTMINWHELHHFNVGIVKEVIAYLVKIRDDLSNEDRNLVMIFDEMDGRRGLTYDKKRDMFIGLEDIFGRREKLAKKFLTVMVRGLSEKIGNLIFANYATANGLTGIF